MKRLCLRKLCCATRRVYPYNEAVRSVGDPTRPVEDITRLIEDATCLIEDTTRSVEDVTRSVEDTTRPVEVMTHPSDSWVAHEGSIPHPPRWRVKNASIAARVASSSKKP